MSTKKNRIAVMVVHGMGSQFPMDTLRGFVDSLKPPAYLLYSSPNRITEERETRRLSFDEGPYDFYEFYWAHQVEEPGIVEILRWAVKLVFIKKPSERLKPHITSVRIFIILTLLLIATLGFVLYSLLKDKIDNLVNATLIGAVLFFLSKIAFKLISGTIIGRITSSIGDVIKYTIPSPENIATREQIRKSGFELLKNLHEAKDDYGNVRYSTIIVAAHSLGTIVAYDILSSLFVQYHKKYSQIPSLIRQKALEKIKNYTTTNLPSATEYQDIQAEVYNEYSQIGNEWRVSNFITMGSPLTHSSMLLARSEEDLSRKINQREFPVCPPIFDKKDNHFAFSKNFRTDNDEVEISILHHAAHFAETQWTNIYYENDWIGGSLGKVLGWGIEDIPVKATGKRTASIPMASHTKYWDMKENASLIELTKIFNKICPF